MLDNNNNSATRRGVLQTIGGFTATIGGVGIGAADSGEKNGEKSQRDSEKIRQQALQILDLTSSQEKFQKFLRNHGFKVASVTKTETPTANDGVTIQDSQDNITTTLTLYSDCQTNSINANFDWEYGNDSEKAFNKEDVNTLSFDYDHFDVLDHYAGSYCSFMEKKGGGVAYLFNSSKAYNNNTNSSYIDAKLDPTGSYSESDRVVNGDVHHFHGDFDSHEITWYGSGAVEVVARSEDTYDEVKPGWVSHTEKKHSESYHVC